MPQYPRYAIYFVPPADSALYRFGASLLGYDAFAGTRVPFADGIEAQAGGWSDVTTEPRKYGFHATLKAPMRLAAGRSEAELTSAVHEFLLTPREIPEMKPVVRAIGSFVAIVPDTPSPALQKLADDCVIAFDSFRAPLAPEDRARRNVAALTEQQIKYLDRWGYPYVFGEFRFHMTLTGPLPAGQRDSILPILQARLAALDIRSLRIGEAALLRQNNADSGFTVIAHAPLRAPF